MRYFIITLTVVILSSIFSLSNVYAAAPILYPAFSDAHQTTATITWTTDGLATSTVNYGTTASYGTASSTSVATTSHSITLVGLTASTTYHYQVVSSNSDGSTSSSDYTFDTVYSCTYYVDSVSGSDSNAGTTAEAPLRRLSTVPAVSNGSTICLRRNSTFTDSLIVGISSNRRDNITVRDYGPINLPMPMIDNSNTIPASAWSLTGGTTNVYQATVPGPGTSTTTPYGTFTDGATLWINLFECRSSPCTPPGKGGNDFFLSNKTSTASVDSNAGSYYIPGMTSSVNPTDTASLTIYIHSSDNTNPSTNGYTYTYSHRFFGVQVAGANAQIINIASKKSSGNGGGIVQTGDGGSPIFTNIEASQGGKHNLLCSGGCTVNNSNFFDEYYGGSGNMLVAFDGTGSGLPVTVSNTNFYQGTSTIGNSVTAFYAHTNTGNLGALIWNSGVIKNNFGIDLGGISTANVGMTVSGLMCDNVKVCISGGQGTTTVNNVQTVSSELRGITTGRALYSTGHHTSTSTVSNSQFCGPANQGVVATGYNNGALSVATSTFYLTQPHNGAGLYNTGTSNRLSMSSTTIESLVDFSLGLWNAVSTSSSPYTGNFNVFTPVSPKVRPAYINNSTVYSSLASWQAASGQDANSSTTGGAISACTLPSLALTGPSSGAVNSASTNFTVTPNKTFTGTATVIPTGAGSTGLIPTTLTFSNSSSAQTFTITPKVSGEITLRLVSASATTSPAFNDPTSLAYTASASVPGAPTLVSATAGNGQATITFSGPTSNGGATISLYTITSTSGSISTTTTTTSGVVTGLSNATTYTFTVTATNSAGTGSASSASNSVTPRAIATLTTSAASSITETGATLNGTITDTGGQDATVRGFVYGLTTEYSATTSDSGTFSTGAFTATLTSLTCGTTYHIASYSTNDAGTAYSSDGTFTTSSCPTSSSGSSSRIVRPWFFTAALRLQE